MESSTKALNDNFTRHAIIRMNSRGVDREAVRAALDYGRAVRIRGAEIYALGRKEVAKLAKLDIDVAEHEGVQVVCSHDGRIITVYRNRDFSGLRAFRVRRRRNQAA